MTDMAVHEADEDMLTDDRPVRRRLGRPMAALLAVPHVGTYAGMAVVVCGVLLLAVAWVRVAALSVVSLQLPYLVSAGVTGLALVAIGLMGIQLSAKAADARAKNDQLAELRDLLAELRASIERPSRGPR